MKNKHPRKDAKGFTLVEILVAMVIFSVTLFTLFSSFKAFLSSDSFVTREITQEEQMRLGLKRIVMDLEHLFIIEPPRYQKPSFNSDPDEYRFQGTQTRMKGKSFSHIRFTSLGHAEIGVNKENGVARIEYYVHENGHGLDLLRSDSLAPYPDAQNPCSDPILFKDITDFTLTYEALDGEEHDSWDSESKSFDFIFPARVKIRVGLKTGTRFIETAVRLPVNREAIQ